MDSDFDQIRALLQRACDQCLLTRKHCENCNVDRLQGIIEGIETGTFKPSYLVHTEDLAALTDPTSPKYAIISEKWKSIITKSGSPATR